MPPKKKSKEAHKDKELEMEVDNADDEDPNQENLQVSTASRGFHPEGTYSWLE